MRRIYRIALAMVLAAGCLGVVGPTRATVAAADPLPACTYADRMTRYGALGDWYRSLVDTKYRLKGSYVPKDLVPVGRSGAPGSGYVRSIVMRDLRAMVRASQAAGAPFAVISAYRSYGHQVGTFTRWVRRSGFQAALLASARPGHSEHQLGTSMDFTSPSRVSGGRAIGVGPGPWQYADWGTTRPGAWLRRNSWRFGLVMSYPKAGSPELTCYRYEPWHFRYVGRTVARAIHRSRLTPREWLWQKGAMSTWTGPTPTGT